MANPSSQVSQDSSLAPDLELTIVDLSRGGAGVARTESGKAIFVPLTAPGDRVRARIWKDEGRYAHADLLELLEPSPGRVEPRCPVFGRCGGCQWQHLPYPEQWRVKKSGALHALTRVGVLTPDLSLPTDEFPAREEYGYRNRIQLRGHRETFGFFARRSRDGVAIESCPVARPEINAALPKLREEAATRDDYKVEIEVLGDGQVRWIWNSRHAAGGFRQVNDEQNARLRDWVSEHLTPDRHLYDLFGGAGNLSWSLAERMSRIDCVDTGSPGAQGRPADAPKNLLFHRADVAQWLKGETRKIERIPELDRTRATSAILDPPREGCGPKITSIVESMKKLHCDEILAVGCDPDSWARDVGRWVRHGFEPVRLAFFDFFPQTPHLESVALLRRRN